MAFNCKLDTQLKMSGSQPEVVGSNPVPATDKYYIELNTRLPQIENGVVVFWNIAALHESVMFVLGSCYVKLLLH